MIPKKVEEAPNDLLAALRARPRKHYEFEVNGLVGLDRKTVHKVAVRVATKREQDSAIKQADDYIKELSDNNPALAQDPDVVYDARAAYIIASVLRDADRPDKMPIFPNGKVITELLSTDCIAALLALVNQVRQLESPNKAEVTEDKVDNIVTICRLAGDTPLVEQALAGFTRAEMECLVIKLALRLAAPPPVEDDVAELTDEDIVQG